MDVKLAWPRPARRAGRALYRTVVVLSAVVVVLYGLYRYLTRPPEVAAGPPIPPAGAVPGGPQALPDAGAPVRRDYTYTFLLAATDQSSGNTDTMMVATYDTVNQTIGMVSLPRDTMIDGVRASDGYRFYKLNSMYAMNGIDALREEAGRILGFPIDFYVKINTRGFVELIDAVDGIDFDVPVYMNYTDPTQDLRIRFDPGMQHLSGTDALKVARCRQNSDGPGAYPHNVYDAYPNADIGRTETQRNLVFAVLKKAISRPQNFPTYISIFTENVETNLTASDLAYFASKAVELDFSSGVSTAVLPGDGLVTYHGWTYCYQLYPDQVLEIVNTQGLNPYTGDITADMLHITQK